MPRPLLVVSSPETAAFSRFCPHPHTALPKEYQRIGKAFQNLSSVFTSSGYQGSVQHGYAVVRKGGGGSDTIEDFTQLALKIFARQFNFVFEKFLLRTEAHKYMDVTALKGIATHCITKARGVQKHPPPPTHTHTTVFIALKVVLHLKKKQQQQQHTIYEKLKFELFSFSFFVLKVNRL